MPKDPTKTGALACTWTTYFAPTDTAAPSASTTPASPWVEGGIIQGDPALTIEIEKVVRKASNACDPLAESIKSRTLTWGIAHAQMSKQTVEHVFGSGTWSASGTGEKWVPDAALAATEMAVLFVLPVGDTELRVYHPRASITPDGDATFSTGEEGVAFPVMITALKPAAGNTIEIYASEPLDAA